MTGAEKHRPDEDPGLCGRMLESVPAIVLVVDENGLRYANGAYFSLSSFDSPDQSSGGEVLRMTKDELIARCRNVMERGSSEEIEMVGRTPGGEDVWYRFTVFPIDKVKTHARSAGAIGYEITHFKRFSDDLSHSQSLMSVAERIAQIGTWEWDVERNTVIWSEELYRIYGVSPKDYNPSYQGYLERTHPEDRKQVESKIKNAVELGSSFSQYERVMRPDGSIRNLYTWGYPVIGKEGRVTRFIGVCQDITERKYMESRKDESVSLLSAALEAVSNGVLVINLKGEVSTYNQRFLEMWGIPDDLVSRRSDRQLLEFVSIQLTSPETFMEKVRELYSHPDWESFDILEFKDGRVYERYSRPQRINGAVAGRVWSFLDVTARVKAEKGYRFLAESGLNVEGSLDYQDTLRSIAHMAVPFLADGCAVDELYDDGNLVRKAVAHVRPELESLLLKLGEGVVRVSDSPQPSAVAIRSRAPIVVAETPMGELPRMGFDARRTALIKSLGVRSVASVPLIFAGRVLGALTCNSSVPNRYGELELKLLKGLGRRCEIAINNARLYAEAQAAIEMRDEFISIASHEFKTPLTSIKLRLGLLKKYVGDPASTERVNGILRGVESQVIRLGRLVDEILDASVVGAGKLALNFNRIDYSDFLKRVIDELKDEVKKAGSELNVNIEPSVQGLGDPQRLEQVLMNLILNAAKYGGGQKIEISLRKSKNDSVVFEVKDFGIGIPKEFISSIFDRFERGATGKNYPGLGLGLYIARQIVEAHGGSIRAESGGETGSTFTVELPASVGVTRAPTSETRRSSNP